jgi:hypothetical protein
MTNYQMLIDAIVQEIYTVNVESPDWSEDRAKAHAHRILEIVEEFKSK